MFGQPSLSSMLFSCCWLAWMAMVLVTWGSEISGSETSLPKNSLERHIQDHT